MYQAGVGGMLLLLLENSRKAAVFFRAIFMKVMLWFLVKYTLIY